MLSEPKMPRSMQFHYSHHVTTFNSLHNLNHCFCGTPKCSANNNVKYLHLQFSYFRNITQHKETIIGDAVTFALTSPKNVNFLSCRNAYGKYLDKI